jgi:hypothetical protein
MENSGFVGTGVSDGILLIFAPRNVHGIVTAAILRIAWGTANASKS